MKIPLSLQHRQFPEQPKERTRAIIQLVPENAKEMIISNFDSKGCCYLTVHFHSEDGKGWHTQSNIKNDTNIILRDDARYRWAIVLMPDGIKDEIIELDVDFI